MKLLKYAQICFKRMRKLGEGARRGSVAQQPACEAPGAAAATAEGPGARSRSSAAARHQLGIPLLPGCPQLLSPARKRMHTAQRCGRWGIAVLAKSIAARELNFDI